MKRAGIALAKAGATAGIMAGAMAGVALIAAPARADPGAASEVYSPTVTRGHGEAELRVGALIGGAADSDWQTKFEANYGFADWWRPGVVVEWENQAGQTDLSAWAIENLFDFTATRHWPVHLGAYAEYEFANHGPNQLELKLLMQRQRGPLDVRLNLIATRALGSAPDNGWAFGYAAQASYALNDDFALGVQGFGDAGANGDLSLNDQASYWGPFAQVEVGRLNGSEVELQAGYLVGSSDAAADGVFRLKLEFEFGGGDGD